MKHLQNYNYVRKPRRPRAVKLQEAGTKYFVNEAEDALAVLFKDNLKIEVTKRGHPDFIVFNSDGSIYGFVEVKNTEEKFLKDSQKLYHEFCVKHSLPFLKWTPRTTEQEVSDFLVNRY